MIIERVGRRRGAHNHAIFIRFSFSAHRRSSHSHFITDRHHFHPISPTRSLLFRLGSKPCIDSSHQPRTFLSSFYLRVLSIHPHGSGLCLVAPSTKHLAVRAPSWHFLIHNQYNLSFFILPAPRRVSSAEASLTPSSCPFALSPRALGLRATLRGGIEEGAAIAGPFCPPPSTHARRNDQQPALHLLCLAQSPSLRLRHGGLDCVGWRNKVTQGE